MATIESLLGGCLTAGKRYADAEPLLLESYPIIKANFGDAHPRTQAALKRRRSLRGMGETGEGGTVPSHALAVVALTCAAPPRFHAQNRIVLDRTSGQWQVDVAATLRMS